MRARGGKDAPDGEAPPLPAQEEGKPIPPPAGEMTSRKKMQLTLILSVALMVVYCGQSLLITASKNDDGGYDYEYDYEYEYVDYDYDYDYCYDYYYCDDDDYYDYVYYDYNYY